MSALRDKLKEIANLKNETANQPQFVAPVTEEESSHASSHETEEIEVEEEEETPAVSTVKSDEESLPAVIVPNDQPKDEKAKEPIEPAVEPATVAAPTPATTAPKLSPEEEDVASQYRKMLKMGMPIGAVQQKMAVDGVDQKIIDDIVGGEGTGDDLPEEEMSVGGDVAEKEKSETVPPLPIPSNATPVDEPQPRSGGDDDGIDQGGTEVAGGETTHENGVAGGETTHENGVAGGETTNDNGDDGAAAALPGAAPSVSLETDEDHMERDTVVNEGLDAEGMEEDRDESTDVAGASGVPVEAAAGAQGAGDIESGDNSQTERSKPISSNEKDKERKRKGLQCLIALICLVALAAGLPFFVPFVEDEDTFRTVQRTGDSPTTTPVTLVPTGSSMPTLTPNPTSTTPGPTASPSETTDAPQPPTPSQPPVTQTSPTQQPTESVVETPAPTTTPETQSPTSAPVTPSPTGSPTAAPVTPAPTVAPTVAPTTPSPTKNPTTTPTTPAPTASPTAMPTTPPPTELPTAMPVTPAPTSAPTTLAPTAMPVTPAPTPSPTSTPTPAPSPAPSDGIFTPFVSQLEAISGEGVFEDADSPQSRALQFLIEEGYGDSEVGARVLERYAALVFYYATGGDSSWFICFKGHLNCGSDQWLEGDVCGWQYISCNGNGFVTSLDIAADNGLTGSIPQEVAAFEFLEEFVLVDSNMEGSLPEELGETAGNIRIFRLENNNFSGTIASGFLRNSPVESLVLAGNSLTGSIPESIYALTDLEQLYLNDNNGLSGRLSPSIGNLEDLLELRVSNTQLGGLIPNEIFQLTDLEELDLSSSQFRGPISSAFVGLSDTINRLYLDNNQFAGTVPGDFGLLTNLQELTLEENMLTGSISSTICSLRDNELRVLTVDCGEILCQQCPTHSNTYVRLSMRETGCGDRLSCILYVPCAFDDREKDRHAQTGLDTSNQVINVIIAIAIGGVWKNSEDEILKAAVQKYGKQQWARVASLLNRKSAKQCKARWHEWLDPSVRKVEWSREEEEKLLHLAKLMPAQWKTIGPLVGRTATQCQEHYEKLLDEAAAGKAGDDGEEQNLRGQPLRVGQIDSHPETKPARPDPIDMDEDEIEMLQEARARLANTQGKKAKRKAREKMLAQAKRLSELQKRRELKQAGLLSSSAKRKAKRSREIDLGVEIPFHKPAPAGFHDVSSEAARSESIRAKRLKSVDYKKLNEQQYRSRDRDAAQAKKREEARLRTLEKSNMQYVVAQVSKANDPLNIRKRGPLELPEPSVTDQELKQQAKTEQGPEHAGLLEGGSGATKALLADYSDRPLPTPMRTPMTGTSGSSKQQSILREASNLRALERGQTPLLGGDDPAVGTEEGDDIDDSKPAARITTPGIVAERTKTPRRDHFGLNQRPRSELRGPIDDYSSVGGTTFATNASIRELAREERRAAKLARKELEEALAALPAPQFDYELEAPMDLDDGEEHKVETVMEEDAADIDAAERKRLQEEADKLYEARSSVVKRSELPRPVGAIPETRMVSEDSFEQMIDAERWMLLRHDAHAFPVDPLPSMSGDKKKKKHMKQAPLPPETPIDIIPEDALNAAKQSIQSEATRLLEEKVGPLLSEGCTHDNAMDKLKEEILDARQSVSSNEVFVPEQGWVKKTDTSLLQSYEGEFDAIQEATSAMRKKNEKAESKLAVLIGGYSKRAQMITTEIIQSFNDCNNLKIEQAVYARLQEQEEKGSVMRMDRLRKDIQRLQKEEMELKEVYDQIAAGKAAS
eukprot:scaffold2816_cov121-Cylindrotheca_fusiformis.AAC.8